MIPLMWEMFANDCVNPIVLFHQIDGLNTIVYIFFYHSITSNHLHSLCITFEFTRILERSGKMSGATIRYTFFLLSSTVSI